MPCESLHNTEQPISRQKLLTTPEFRANHSRKLSLKHKCDRNRDTYVFGYTWGAVHSLKHRNPEERQSEWILNFLPTSSRLLLKAAAGDTVFRMAENIRIFRGLRSSSETCRLRSSQRGFWKKRKKMKKQLSCVNESNVSEKIGARKWLDGSEQWQRGLEWYCRRAGMRMRKTWEEEVGIQKHREGEKGIEKLLSVKTYKWNCKKIWNKAILKPHSISGQAHRAWKYWSHEPLQLEELWLNIYINTFINIKWYQKIFIWNKCCRFELYIHQRILNIYLIILHYKYIIIIYIKDFLMNRKFKPTAFILNHKYVYYFQLH